MYNSIIESLKLNISGDKIKQIITERYQGKLIVHLSLNTELTPCPNCSSYNISKSGTRIRQFIHSYSSHESCIIKWKYQRFICRFCKKSFSESNPFSVNKKRINLFTKIMVLDELKSPNRTFTDVSKQFHLSPQSVINILDDFIQPHRLTIPEVLCMDEVYISKFKKYKYALVLYDPVSKKLIDLMPTRHFNYMKETFARIDKNEKKSLKYVVIDMYEPYKRVIEQCFGSNVIIAVDSFHVVKLINTALNTVRKKIMARYYQKKDSNTSDIYYMLKKYYWIILADKEKYKKNFYIPKFRCTYTPNEVLKYLLDIDQSLADAYKLKERYREWNLSSDSLNREDEFNQLIADFKTHPYQEIRDVSKTLTRWKKEIFNSFIVVHETRLHNGHVERVNSKIKVILKTSNGIKSFDRLRKKVFHSLNKDTPLKN